MEPSNLLLSPQVKRGRAHDQNVSDGKDELASNKSSPGKIQSSQKEIDDFFENFQQQIQVRFINFDENIQECDVQVKKCLNQIFETEIIKEKKQIQTFSARPPSTQKKNKIIFLNPFQANDNGCEEIDIQSSEGQQIISNPASQNNPKSNIKTSDFLETINLTNQFSKQNANETQTNKTSSIFPTIQNKISTYNMNMPTMNGVSGFNSRFRAHSINDSVSDNLHKQFVQQRNNCNQGDNIFIIRDHKFERQRILSNENRVNKNIQNNQQQGIFKHPYLNQIHSKAIEQKQQQQNFLSSLRNAFRVTFNNTNPVPQNESIKNQQIIEDQELSDNQNLENSSKQQCEKMEQQEGFSKVNQAKMPIQSQQNNNNNNVKVFKRKDRNFRPALVEKNKSKQINNQSLETKNLKSEEENSNNSPEEQFDLNEQTLKISNQNGKEQIRSDFCNESSQFLVKQIQDLNMNLYANQYQNNCLKTLQNTLDLEEKAQQFKEETQINQIQNYTMNRNRNIQTFNTQINEESSFQEFKENAVSDKPKKKVIKISKESVFCKIIQEQKEKQFQKKESNTQIMLATKQRQEPNTKQMSHDFQETKFPQFLNNNFQIYQDNNLVQKFTEENLNQKVKMFKFNKKIQNKTENAVEKAEQQNSLNLQLIVDKENISENILNNLSQVDNTKEDNPLLEQQRFNRAFNRNKAFHNKNRSLNNETSKKYNQQNQIKYLNIQDETLQNSGLQYNIQLSQIHSPSFITKKINQNEFVPQNKKYDIDEIKNSIFLKKSISSQNTGSTFFKNQLNQQITEKGDQENQSYLMLQKNRQTFKSLYNPSSLSQLIKKINNECNQDEQQDENLRDQAILFKDKQFSNINPYEPQFLNFENKPKITSNFQNNNSQKTLNGTKKFFGLNNQRENMFIQNIDEFKEKINKIQ